MAMLWQENFIDASRHWTGRGQGFEAPLGENVLQLPGGIVFSTQPIDKEWPTEFAAEARPLFKGYRFDRLRQPIFKYLVGDVTIEDKPLPEVVEDRPLFKRNLRIVTSGTKTISYLAAVGKAIEVDGETIKVGEDYKTKLTNVKEIKLIKLGDKQAAVAIIDLSSGVVEVEQSYDW